MHILYISQAPEDDQVRSRTLESAAVAYKRLHVPSSVPSTFYPGTLA